MKAARTSTTGSSCRDAGGLFPCPSPLPASPPHTSSWVSVCRGLWLQLCPSYIGAHFPLCCFSSFNYLLPEESGYLCFLPLTPMEIFDAPIGNNFCRAVTCSNGVNGKVLGTITFRPRLRGQLLHDIAFLEMFTFHLDINPYGEGVDMLMG